MRCCEIDKCCFGVSDFILILAYSLQQAGIVEHLLMFSSEPCTKDINPHASELKRVTYSGSDHPRLIEHTPPPVKGSAQDHSIAARLAPRNAEALRAGLKLVEEAGFGDAQTSRIALMQVRAS